MFLCTFEEFETEPVQSEECTLCVYAICCKCVADSAVDGYLSESNVLI